jgi:hypothetical protein
MRERIGGLGCSAFGDYFRATKPAGRSGLDHASKATAPIGNGNRHLRTILGRRLRSVRWLNEQRNEHCNCCEKPMANRLESKIPNLLWLL